MPAHDVMTQSEFLYYAANERGLRIMLGEGEYIQFSQSADKPWLAQIKINRRDDDGKFVPIEEAWEKARKLEKTRHYEKGWIQYVPSPEELRFREKIARQNEACDQLKEDLRNELLTLSLDKLGEGQLKALADRVGAPMKDKSGRVHTAAGLRNSISRRLELDTYEPEPEPVTVAAEVKEPEPEPEPEPEKPKEAFSGLADAVKKAQGSPPKRRTTKKRGK